MHGTMSLKNVCVYMYVCIYMSVCVHACVCVCVRMRVCACVRARVRVCVCVCVWSNKSIWNGETYLTIKLSFLQTVSGNKWKN